MKIQAIRKRLAEIKAECTQIVNSADADNGGKLSEENQAKFDALMQERENLESHAKRLDQIESMNIPEERIAAPVAPKTETEKPVAVIGSVKPAIESDPMRGFKSAAEFGLTIQAAGKHGARIDERLLSISREELGGVVSAPSGYMTERGSSDGYMVPPQISNEVTKLVLGDEGLLAKFNPEPTLSNSVEDLVDETTPWGSTGVLAYWGEEAGQMTSSKPVTRVARTNLHKLYAFVSASDELLEDAPRLENRLTIGAADAIRYKANDALINGNGTGKPLGVLSADCNVSQAKESGQTADTIVAKNLLRMRSRLFGSDAGAFWLAHSTCIPELGGVYIGDKPMLKDNLRDGYSIGTVLGLPVYVSEHCQAVGDNGDIQLIQPKGYMSYIKAGGIKFALSMHLYFDYGLSAFRWTFRLGGQPKFSAAVTQDNGSGTLSHFVSLAAR